MEKKTKILIGVGAGIAVAGVVYLLVKPKTIPVSQPLLTPAQVTALQTKIPATNSGLFGIESLVNSIAGVFAPLTAAQQAQADAYSLQTFGVNYNTLVAQANYQNTLSSKGQVDSNGNPIPAVPVPTQAQLYNLSTQAGGTLSQTASAISAISTVV